MKSMIFNIISQNNMQRLANDNHGENKAHLKCIRKSCQ